jgi:solute carrier family 25 (mitochondrial folate transporter), member 32
MVAGGASTICTSPLWVVKTRIMVCGVFSIRGGRLLMRLTRYLCIYSPLLVHLITRLARHQAQPLHEKPYKHTLDCFLTIYRSEGPRAFYRGLLTSLLGISHVAVQFPLYEQLKDWAGESPLHPHLPLYMPPRPIPRTHAR